METLYPEIPKGTMLSSRYIIDNFIGSGSMGKVYKAYDEKLEIDVAIKFLPTILATNPRAAQTLKQEAKMALKLAHKGIVRYINLEQDGNALYLIMEYVYGQSLDTLLGIFKKFKWEQVLIWAKQICDALGYAHKEGVVHRDLKPSNFLLELKKEKINDLEDIINKNIKISDFGLAAEVKDSLSKYSKTMTVGTICYMSPEQINGETASPAMDIYSLGCTLYELLVGHPPFSGRDPAVIYQHLNKNPNPLGKDICPAWFNDIILKCLEKKPEKRFRSAEDLKSKLEKNGKTENVIFENKSSLNEKENIQNASKTSNEQKQKLENKKREKIKNEIVFIPEYKPSLSKNDLKIDFSSFYDLLNNVYFAIIFDTFVFLLAFYFFIAKLPFYLLAYAFAIPDFVLTIKKASSKIEYYSISLFVFLLLISLSLFLKVTFIGSYDILNYNFIFFLLPILVYLNWYVIDIETVHDYVYPVHFWNCIYLFLIFHFIISYILISHNYTFLDSFPLFLLISFFIASICSVISSLILRLEGEDLRTSIFIAFLYFLVISLIKSFVILFELIFH